MEELEFLKKNWNKSKFPEISESDIYAMLHKNSTTTVKWIFYVSILEFVVLNGLGILLSDRKYDNFLQNNPLFTYLEYLNYAIILFFIYLFYKNFREISVLSNAKKLMELILKTRKVVTYYIYWNIFIGGLSGVYAAIAGFTDGYNVTSKLRHDKLSIEINYISLLLAMIIVIGAIWMFYKLLYGRFLNKLNGNYKELIKIDL